MEDQCQLFDLTINLYELNVLLLINMIIVHENCKQIINLSCRGKSDFIR